MDDELGGVRLQSWIIGEYEKKPPQAQKALVNLMINTQGMRSGVIEAVQKELDRMKTAHNEGKPAKKTKYCVCTRALQTALRDNEPTGRSPSNGERFALDVHDALNDEPNAARHGFTYDHLDDVFSWSKPKGSGLSK